MTTQLKRLALVAGLLSTLHPQLSTVFAQGSAFTYQGRLSDGIAPFNGPADFEFRLYNAASGGFVIAATAAEDVAVTNGLFTVSLDLGSWVFDGSFSS